MPLCDCERYCMRYRTEPKEVSATTYRNHKPYRKDHQVGSYAAFQSLNEREQDSASGIQEQNHAGPSNSVGIPQRRQRPVDDEGDPDSHAQLEEQPSASPFRSSSISSTAHVPSNKRHRLGNPEDSDDGQPNSTVSVADHVSPQNSQNIQSQEGGSSCGPRIDAGEDVTRINIDNEEMARGFGDTGRRNEYDDDELEPDLGSMEDRPQSPPPEDNPDEMAQQEQPPQEAEDIVATLEELKIAQAFIKAIQDASLDKDDLDPSVRERLRNPIQEPLDLSEEPATLTSIELFLDTTTASQNVYENVCATLIRHMQRTNPGVEFELLSHYRVQGTIAELTGVYSIMHDMCLNSCIAYTGPFSDLPSCPKCEEPRYKITPAGRERQPQRQFHTIPLGPQLQALWRSPKTAKKIRHRSQETKRILEELERNGNRIEKWEDIYHGNAYLDAVRAGNIKDEDMVLLLSIDGAQLYQSKQSDCWIYIWVFLDFAPDSRYMKGSVYPGGFIPGPNKPKHVDSYLFPGFHHLAALMKEGLGIWDAARDITFITHPFLHLGTADGPGMTYLNGLTGHSGAFGCRLYCAVKGRRKEGGNHYYPALLKPNDYDVAGCNHDDVDGSHLPSANIVEYEAGLQKVLLSRTTAQHEENRKDTGITKPSIFSGFPTKSTLGVPLCFGADLMHLISLNLTDLLLGLWRGTIQRDPLDNNVWDWVVLTGNTWKEHGRRVAELRPYLPGSFDRPPRNPAEKISSGYKAWEYLTYIFSAGPALLQGILPDMYWRNYCKLVRGVRLVHQRSVTEKQLIEAHKLLVDFVREFEEIYYQRKATRLHFCRQSIHALLHLVPEVIRLGPGVYYTQWTMERTIGNLGEEIKQPSQPFANLSERGLRRCQVNALKSILPHLETEEKLPRISFDLGNGFVLLGAREEYQRKVPELEAAAIREQFTHLNQNVDPLWQPSVRRWARLRLPNGQIVRSAWKEKLKPLNKVRMARNVMFYWNDLAEDVYFGEVQYFFQAEVPEHGIITLALASVYGPPDQRILAESSNALWTCTYSGREGFQVFPVTWIKSCVAMPPLKKPADQWFFVCEKMGLEVASMGGDIENANENEDDNMDDMYL